MGTWGQWEGALKGQSDRNGAEKRTNGASQGRVPSGLVGVRQESALLLPQRAPKSNVELDMPTCSRRGSMPHM